MPSPPKSFEIRTSSPERVRDALLARSQGGSEASARDGSLHLVFICGDLARQGAELAVLIAASDVPGKVLVVPGSGVLSEAGEIESESAAVVLALPAGTAHVTLGPSSGAGFGRACGKALASLPGASALVLIRGDQSDDGWMHGLDETAGTSQGRVFGGGTMPSLDLWVVDQHRAASGAAAAVIIERPWLGRLAASSACRLVSSLHEVTKTRGPLLLELDGVSALDLLGASTEGFEEQPLILLAIGAREDALSAEGRNLALRAIVGVDPGQGGVLIGDELPTGTKVAFAVRDARGARADLESHLRGLRRSCAGAAPAFGLFVSCAGRGRALYAAPDVDVRLIKQYFPGMPMAGLHSTFEVAPLDGRPAPQVYSGVLGVFCAPS